MPKRKRGAIAARSPHARAGRAAGVLREVQGMDAHALAAEI